MYCRKCGKQIDYDAPICKECEELETYFGDNSTATTAKPTQQPVNGNKKEGFGLALAGLIISSIAFLVSFIQLSLVTALAEELELGYIYYSFVEISAISTTAIIFSVLSMLASIPALIFGIKSIKRFFRAKKEGRIKPVITLVFGIIATALCAMILLYGFLTIALASFLMIL